MFSCADFIAAGMVKADCCDSCHVDDGMGYGPMCEYYHPTDKTIWAHVCCGTARQFDDGSFDDSKAEDWNKLFSPAAKPEGTK